MRTEQPTNNTFEVSYLKTDNKDSTRAKLIGKGRVILADGIIYFEGKKRLPLWLSLLLIIGVPNLLNWILTSYVNSSGNPYQHPYLNYAGPPFVAGSVLLMLLAVYIVRLKESGDVKDSAVKAIIEDRGKQYFLLLADFGQKLPVLVAWQATSDAATLSKIFRDRFPSSLKEGKINGKKVF
jgi:hypothetical protein